MDVAFYRAVLVGAVWKANLAVSVLSPGCAERMSRRMSGIRKQIRKAVSGGAFSPLQNVMDNRTR